MKVFFWQNTPSHIQTGALEEFARLWPDEVTGVWCENLYPIRKNMGWEVVPTRYLKNFFLHSQNWPEEVALIVSQNPQAIHILSAIGAYPPVTMVAKLLRNIPGARLGLIAERPKAFGWKTPLRELKGWFSYLPYRRLIGMILTFGEHGINYYRKIGFPPEILHYYTYQCPFTLGSASPPSDENCVVRFVYAGQLHPRKGVDLLVKAFASLPRGGWTLDLYGCGPLEKRLRREVKAQDCGESIRFKGVYPSGEVLEIIKNYDVCCVPSRFDAWGLSVNEAFQAGIPSVVSSQVGASQLIRHSGCGVVYKSESKSALSLALLGYLKNHELITREKSIAQEYGKKLSATAVGSYLSEVVSFAFSQTSPALCRPKAPWL